MDGKGDALPAEMLPSQIDYGGAQFQLPAAGTGIPNAIIAKGQTITLPAGTFNRVFILAASTGSDQQAEFRAGSKTTPLTIQSWDGFVGQWDTRVWNTAADRDWAISAHHAAWPPPDMEQREGRPANLAARYPESYVGLRAGYVKPASLAWYASHHHTPEGLNEPYQYSYLFAYSLEIPAGTKTLTLPDNDKIRIFAISAAEDNPWLRPAAPLYDTLGTTEPSVNLEPANY